ncbi:phosphonate metabolism protein/1,5-bisphosphokinase (PRPP-forming) PhnN [Bosea sp. (in: a-proteobacteria)]|uniref:phosphonate metabolism protein/1,5-bisphosphokinase (PRPP-forming) PhnN n=1 Tax=Bosea sp. (in: a-proteobacteria) TaxID=1871050 RepID=UPI00122079D0|nr:phosphonate metabolism protein/1,5-bisphosphokinase (PRPP-forming) PhnN [Bosea sp. (in: a-proteobacteria)]TAJ28777.1 MAG: phosphonate metabolism protein/1,5-bisphosphokinase (PRPP-forming) PhnN [Bosea sp. (in: a-proteobacteria)]
MTSLLLDDAISAPPAGALVLVVGPSGAGKDTLMDAARAALAGEAHFRFARRLITRPAMAGAEDHDSCGEAAFAAAEARGELALSWRAHGLSYGIPAAELLPVAQGRVVVANVSRAAIREAERLAERAVVVNVTAPPMVLAKRLAVRGRESEADIAARLAREAPLAAERAEIVTILNDRTVAEAAGDLIAVLRKLGRQGDQPSR